LSDHRRGEHHLLAVRLAEDAHGIGFGEKLESHVAPLLAPLVVLFGEHRADEADDRGAIGEGSDDVCPPADLPVQAFLRVVAPALPPELAGECREREQIVTGVVEVRSGIGQLSLEGRNDPVELGGDRCCVGLVEDRPHERRHPRLGGLGDLLQEVAQVVRATPLPTSPRKRRPDRADETLVGVGGDETDTGEPACDEPPEEREPSRPGLLRGDVDPEDLPVTLGAAPVNLGETDRSLV